MHSDPYSGPGKTYLNSDENRQSLYPPFSDQKGAQTIPFGAAHTFKANIREHSPPSPPRQEVLRFQYVKL